MRAWRRGSTGRVSKCSGSSHGRSRHPLDGDERRLSRGHRGGRHLGAHRARHLWASRLTTIGLTPPFPFVSVPKDRWDSRRVRGQQGKVIDDLHSAHGLGPSSTPDPGVILGSDASFTERDPVDADAADLGGATGAPAPSAARSRKESTRDAERSVEGACRAGESSGGREAQPAPAHGARDGAWSQRNGAGRSHERVPLSGCRRPVSGCRRPGQPARGPDDRYDDPGDHRLAAESSRRGHGERAVQAIRQGDLRLRRQLRVRGGSVRGAFPEGCHFVSIRIGSVQHHDLRQPMAGRSGRARLDCATERHHRREPRARYRVRGGRGDRLPDLSRRLGQYLRVPPGGRHHCALRAPGPDERPSRARRLQGGQ